MALSQCPEYGKEISDKAAACPHFGHPINSDPSINENKQTCLS